MNFMIINYHWHNDRVIISSSDFYTKWLKGIDSDWDLRNAEGGSRLNQPGARSSMMNMSRRSSRMVCSDLLWPIHVFIFDILNLCRFLIIILEYAIQTAIINIIWKT